MKPIALRLSGHEQRWCLSANRLCARKTVRAYFRLVSRLGDGSFWYALMLMISFGDGWRGLGVATHLAVVGAVSTLFYRRLKQWTRRPRPFAADPRIEAWIAPLDEYSFPSGHTLHAVAFTWVALAYYPGLAILLLPFTLSVAASRVMLGMHYPSDVLAASGIGAAIAGLSLCLSTGVFPA
jgi:undecaprenyl-diphosphatase